MNKKLFKNVSLCILCLVFAFIPFVSLFNNNNHSSVVYADSVDTSYYFHSSDTYYISATTIDNNIKPVLFSSDNFYRDGVLSIDFNIYLSYATAGHSTVDYYFCNFFQQYYNSNIIDSGDGNKSYVIDFDKLYIFYFSATSADGSRCRLEIKATSGFNSDVYKINLYSSDTSPINSSSSSKYHYFNIQYISTNESSLTYSFSVPTNYKFDFRTYYLVSSDNLTDNQLYNQGYQQGLLDNQFDIYNSGYSAGQIVGYDTGYNAGVSDSSDYSFISLFGAVLDAPIQTIRGLFNFNLLGVNLLSFFTGLFTLAVILFVVKLILGGK